MADRGRHTVGSPRGRLWAAPAKVRSRTDSRCAARRRSPGTFDLGGQDVATGRREPVFDISSDDERRNDGPSGSGLMMAERQQLQGYADIAPQAIDVADIMQEDDGEHSSTSSFDVEAEIAAVQRERDERNARQADADLGPLPPERTERCSTPVGKLMRAAREVRAAH